MSKEKVNVDIEAICQGKEKVEQAFAELKPQLEAKVVEKTAIVAYHRPPVKDERLEGLRGLIFPPEDLKKLYNKICTFNIHKPRSPTAYIGVDVYAKQPKEVLLYGFEHVKEAPQKIMQNPGGKFYLTAEPLLGTGSLYAPMITLYVAGIGIAVSMRQTRDDIKESTKSFEKALAASNQALEKIRELELGTR